MMKPLLPALGATPGQSAVEPVPRSTGMPPLTGPGPGADRARSIPARGPPVVEGGLGGQAEPPRPFMPWVRQVTLGGRRLSIPQVK